MKTQKIGMLSWFLKIMKGVIKEIFFLIYPRLGTFLILWSRLLLKINKVARLLMGYVLSLKGKSFMGLEIINNWCFINRTKWEISEL